jgi:hypothetical protein
MHNRTYFSEEKRKIFSSEIGKIEIGKYYHFFSQGRWSSPELLMYLMETAGKGSIQLTTFSFSDESLGTLLHGKNNGVFSEIEIVADYFARNASKKIIFFAENIADVYYGNIHEKIIIVKAERLYFLVNSSANFHRNPKHECGFVCTIPSVINTYSQYYEILKKTCLKLKDLKK